MQVCSYTMDCPQFSFDFETKNKYRSNELYGETDLYAFFSIPRSEKFNIKISYPEQNYIQDMKEIRQILWIKFILATLLLSAIALFFTFYSLNPIRKALRLNDEFIKDILHDFNTPITSMVLNIKMFQDEHKTKDPFIQRVSHSVDTILHLQNNLKSFLHHSPSQNLEVDVVALVQKRMHAMQNIYPKITFNFNASNTLKKLTNDDLLTRILDNLLSNAAKYNRTDGKVNITISGEKLSIEDTGKGIKEIDKVLQRYYKEQDRGLGLGLHIVQKLTNELNIKMTIESKIDIGTVFTLDLSALEDVE